MDDDAFAVLCALLMVSDPWPLSEEQQKTITEYADKEARERGCETWVDEYHRY